MGRELPHTVSAYTQWQGVLSVAALLGPAGPLAVGDHLLRDKSL